MRPRNLKQAMENGYIISNIKHAYNERILIVVTKRYPTCEGNNTETYWINRKYFARKYPNTFEKYTI